jgi:hypothetical protein
MLKLDREMVINLRIVFWSLNLQRVEMSDKRRGSNHNKIGEIVEVEGAVVVAEIGEIVMVVIVNVDLKETKSLKRRVEAREVVVKEVLVIKFL